MDHRLLTAAAVFAVLILPSTPAAADQSGGSGMQSSGSTRIVEGSPGHDFGRCRDFRRDRHDLRRDRNFRCDGFGGFAYADGEWALYNNRSWDPDSFNDWWNDRPDRAYPRWVQEQRGGPCDPDRVWWSGTGWHC